MRKPEILAPAGSAESVRAAVAAGCDAVYVGGAKFGARAFADNPDEDGLLEAIRYCHLHGVRVYLTVNTLLKEREMEEALVAYLQPYYEEGVDAVIVQDFGVVRKLQQHFPDLPLHASTQMTITGAGGAEYMKDYGVTRVVPARELSLPELREFRARTSLEMEVFVHGALCYCYSGRCFLSSANGARSGNRGRCAQPCRLAYGIWGTGRTSYLLSPKELCSLEILPELIEAGIDSFKIEGRMKRAEYTAFTTHIYRKYRDLYLERGAQGYREYLAEHSGEYARDLENLEQMYNRSGFTHGYASGDVSDMLSDARPNHNGIRVGKVESVRGMTAQVRLERDIYPQDGMAFRRRGNTELYEYTVGEGKPTGASIQVRFGKDAGVREGDVLYRMKKGPLLAQIREDFLEKKVQAGVAGRAVFRVDSPAELILRMELPWGECEVRQEGVVCQTAEKRAVDAAEIRKILEKTGGEEFCFSELDVQADAGIFIPVGAVKSLRRSAMEALEKEILQMSRRTYRGGAADEKRRGEILRENAADGKHSAEMFRNNAAGRPGVEASRKENDETLPEMIAFVETEEQFVQVVKSPFLSKVVVPLSCGNLTGVLSATEAAGKVLYLRLPRVLRHDGEKRVRRALAEVFAGDGVHPAGVVIRNTEELGLVHELQAEGFSFAVMADFDMYVCNSYAADWLREQGIEMATLSPELAYREICEVSGYVDSDLCYTVYGYQEWMVSAQCAKRGAGICRRYARGGVRIEDVLTLCGREGERYLVRTDCEKCESIVYSGRPLRLFPHWRELTESGVDALRLDFVFENAKETAAVMRTLEACMRGEIPETAAGGEYSGHFLRGVR